MTTFRTVLYILGAATALALAGQFWGVRNLLSRMLSVTMVVWAINCLYMLLLLLMNWSEQILAFNLELRTVNAGLIGLTPIALYIVWNRNGRKDL